MTRLKIPAWIAVMLRIVIAAIFIYAGISKALTPLRFATDIDNFHILPWRMAPLMAFYLPWLEIICGMALLFLRFDRGALLILCTLTFVFAFALISARIRGIDISCGCFGHGARDLSFASHLMLNVGIMVAILLLLKAPAARERT